MPCLFICIHACMYLSTHRHDETHAKRFHPKCKKFGTDDVKMCAVPSKVYTAETTKGDQPWDQCMWAPEPPRRIAGAGENWTWWSRKYHGATKAQGLGCLANLCADAKDRTHMSRNHTPSNITTYDRKPWKSRCTHAHNTHTYTHIIYAFTHITHTCIRLTCLFVVCRCKDAVGKDWGASTAYERRLAWGKTCTHLQTRVHTDCLCRKNNTW